MTTSIKHIMKHTEDEFDTTTHPKSAKAHVGKRPLGFLRGRIKMDVDVKQVGGEELIRLFEGRV